MNGNALPAGCQPGCIVPEAARICPGSCNSGYRRARAVFEAASAARSLLVLSLPEGAELPPAPMMPPEPKPWWGDPAWCGRCAARIRSALKELDDLAALRIAQFPDSQRGGSPDEKAGRITGSPEPASQSGAADDLDEMCGHLLGWEAAARRGDAAPRRGYLATQLTTVIAWLYHHFDEVIAADFAADFGSEVLRWHRELESKVKAGTGMRHRKRACPRCHLYTLWERAGDSYIACRNEDCQRLLSREEYDALADAA